MLACFKGYFEELAGNLLNDWKFYTVFEIEPNVTFFIHRNKYLKSNGHQ